MKKAFPFLIQAFCLGTFGLVLGAVATHADPPFPVPPKGGLPECMDALRMCQEDFQIFPGDGAGHGPELSYYDNDDGTITDENTKFMWEKKLPSDDSDCFGGQANRSVHCVNNTYNWSAATTSFLNKLNNTCQNDEKVVCSVDANCIVVGGVCGFAGYRDWRIPHIKELQSIVDYGEKHPAIADSFLPVSASTASNSHYWSVTTFLQNATDAWVVAFYNGGVEPDDKTISNYVRAVRQGP